MPGALRFSPDSFDLTRRAARLAADTGKPMNSLHLAEATRDLPALNAVFLDVLELAVGAPVDDDLLYAQIAAAQADVPTPAAVIAGSLSDEIRRIAVEDLTGETDVNAWTLLFRASIAPTALRDVLGGFVDLSAFREAGDSVVVEHAPAGSNPAARPTVGVPTQPLPEMHEHIDRQRSGSMLERYTEDLTAAAAEGKLQRLHGRSDELDAVITTLSRATKRNPVLVGEAGVGKTAIAEGLAQRICDGAVPHQLAGRRLLSVDLSGMLAGSKYRGEFEERLRGVINAAVDAEDIILFFDEIHTISGIGAGDSGSDAAGIMKPFLSRSRIQILGATTDSEYLKSFGRDPALARRFTKIPVAAPTVDESRPILELLAIGLAEHHLVSYDPEALSAALHLSERYITDRQLPDKAVDLLDIAGARQGGLSAVPMTPGEEALLALGRTKLSKDVEDALADGEFERAAEARQKLLAVEQASGSELHLPTAVTAQHIAEVVSDLTGIPAGELSSSDQERYSHMEEHLGKRMVGQQTAISAVSRAVRRSRAGLSVSRRPIGSFLFLGSTGVGKTELAKTLAEFMFGSDSALIRFDMSEFMEEHSVSRLIGAPPGYRGHEDGGALTNAVAAKPYSVLLFDEVEKAHDDIFNVLLQVLDDGQLTDSHGVHVDFSNTVIILTSNLGATATSRSVGFSTSAAQADERASEMSAAARRHFRPEFINRLNDILVFDALSADDMGVMAHRMLAPLHTQLADQGITLRISDAAFAALATDGHSVEYGARPLRRLIERAIEDPLADLFFAGSLTAGVIVDVDCIDGDLHVSVASDDTH